jgi:hypothetical protein
MWLASLAGALWLVVFLTIWVLRNREDLDLPSALIRWLHRRKTRTLFKPHRFAKRDGAASRFVSHRKAKSKPLSGLLRGGGICWITGLRRHDCTCANCEREGRWR